VLVAAKWITSFSNKNIVTDGLTMGHDWVLWMHVTTGCIAWILGAVALWKNLPGRQFRWSLAAFHWSVLVVGVTASVLVGTPQPALVAVVASDLVLWSRPARLFGTA